MKSFWTYLATLGPIGYLPASGTCASFLTLGMVYFLHLLAVSDSVYFFIVVLGCIVGWIIIQKVMNSRDRFDDPSEIVLDEVLGCLLTFWGIPVSAYTLAIGFILFRIFDITKIMGIASFEMFFGAWGILLDDLAAGLLSNLFLRILLFLFLYDYLL